MDRSGWRRRAPADPRGGRVARPGGVASSEPVLGAGTRRGRRRAGRATRNRWRRRAVDGVVGVGGEVDGTFVRYVKKVGERQHTRAPAVACTSRPRTQRRKAKKICLFRERVGLDSPDFRTRGRLRFRGETKFLAENNQAPRWCALDDAYVCSRLDAHVNSRILL